MAAAQAPMQDLGNLQSGHLVVSIVVFSVNCRSIKLGGASRGRIKGYRNDPECDSFGVLFCGCSLRHLLSYIVEKSFVLLICLPGCCHTAASAGLLLACLHPDLPNRNAPSEHAATFEMPARVLLQ